MRKINKINILIIGANGFVGNALAKRLLGSKINLFLTSRDKTFKLKGTKVFYGDLSDKTFCKNIVKNIDVVYYLAGFKKNINIHIKEPFNVLSNNVLPLINFLNSVKDSKIKEIVYASSSIVEYADINDKNIDGYVFGKYINEIILKNFTNETGIKVKIVRIAPVYGYGNDFNKETANFIPSIIAKVDSSEKELEVWGKGLRKLQFIYIDDLISNLVAILDNQDTYFSIGNKEALSVNEIVQIVIKVMDKNLKIRNDITKPDKKTIIYKFKNIVEPKFNLDGGIRKTVDYYKNLKNNI